MSTEDNNQTTDDTAATGDEGETTTTEQVADSVPREEYDKLNQTLGSLKRELKDLRKAQESPKDTPTPDANADLLQKTFLRAAGLSSSDEQEFALDKAKKWNVPVDQLVDDEDFKEALDKFRTKKSNEIATSNVRGTGGAKPANQTAEYYIAKGVPPTAEQVPDRKLRASIARAMISSTKDTGKFYNDK